MVKQLAVSVTLLMCFVPVSDAQIKTKEKQPAKTMRLGEREFELVFADNFEDGIANWKTTDDNAWVHKSHQSNHTFGLKQRKSKYKPKFRSPHNIALLKDQQFDDLVIEFDVKSTKDTGNHRDCCVFFCYQNPDQFYYVHLGAKPDSASGQIMLVNQAARSPLTENKRPVPWTDDWHKVRLVFDSATGKISIYFDDMNAPLMSVEDKTFSKGQIGIGSFDDMNDFDNVRVYSPKK